MGLGKTPDQFLLCRETVQAAGPNKDDFATISRGLEGDFGSSTLVREEKKAQHSLPPNLLLNLLALRPALGPSIPSSTRFGDFF